MVVAEYVAFDDAGSGGFGDVADSRGEDGVAVVYMAVFGEEADEALDETKVC